MNRDHSGSARSCVAWPQSQPVACRAREAQTLAFRILYIASTPTLSDGWQEKDNRRASRPRPKFCTIQKDNLQPPNSRNVAPVHHNFTHQLSSSSLGFALWCKSPSAFAGSHLTLTFNNSPMKVNTIHPKCPWNQPPLIPTAYKLAIPTGAIALMPQLIVKATAFSVANVSGLGAISFKQSWMHANDIAMPEPRKMVVNAAVQNAGRRSARRSSLSDGYRAISMGHAMQQMRRTVPVLVLRCRYGKPKSIHTAWLKPARARVMEIHWEENPHPPRRTGVH